MQCPNCKYPNPKGVTYCQMCYEVFSRSAAESYLRTMHRDRLAAQKKEASERIMAPAAASLKNWFKNVDWGQLTEPLSIWARANRRLVLAAIGVLAAGIFWTTWTSAHLGLRLVGTRFHYIFNKQKSLYILVGMKSELREWSEYRAQIDTEMSEISLDEIGTLRLKKESETRVLVEPTQWWLETRRNGNRESHIIPLSSPTLLPGHILLSSRGTVLQRHYGLNSRLAQSIPFMAPILPAHFLHLHDHWGEHIEWIEMLGDWKVHWVAKLDWTLAGEISYGQYNCDQLLYTATLTPQILAGPSWGSFALQNATFDIGTVQGVAEFDHHAGELLANTFSYSGQLRIPTNDLGAIPMEQRIGRSVHHLPGEIVVKFSNTINVRKP